MIKEHTHTHTHTHTLIMFYTYCFTMATVVTLNITLYVHCLPCLNLPLFSVHYSWFSSSYFSVNTFSNDVRYTILSQIYLACIYVCVCVCVCVCVKVNLCLCMSLRHGSVAPFILINFGTRCRTVVGFVPLQLYFFEISYPLN